MIFRYQRVGINCLRRDGADTPIVRVHGKAFLTREHSHSKPSWAPSYSSVSLPNNTTQVAKMHPLTYYQKTVQRSLCLSFLFFFLLSKLTEVINVVLSRIDCNHYKVWSALIRLLVPSQMGRN